MIDLAPKNPDVEFHGFDVDLAQAPPTEWLPSNVKLDVMDLFKPVPEELVGQFECVRMTHSSNESRLRRCVRS